MLLATAAPAVSQSLNELTLERTLTLPGATHHVQGIDLDGERLWVTSVDTAAKRGYLHEFRLSDGVMLRTVEVGEGLRFHPGGLMAEGDSLWMPVAEYRRESSAVIQRRSKKTLQVESQFEVHDHIGCVAVRGGEIVGGNWDSRDFYVWDRSGKELRKVPNPGENHYQDLKFVDGALVGSGVMGAGGAIDWLAWPALTRSRRIEAGKTDRGAPFTAVRGDRLYLLPEDAPIRLFVFRLGK
jgi:hypothetical protein